MNIGACQRQLLWPACCLVAAIAVEPPGQHAADEHAAGAALVSRRDEGPDA